MTSIPVPDKPTTSGATQQVYAVEPVTATGAINAANNAPALGSKTTGIYFDPSTFYISPLTASRDPGLQALYGTDYDPFGNLTADQRAQVTGLENYVASQTPAGGGYYSVGANPFSNLDYVAQMINSTTDPVAHMGYLSQLSMNPNYAQQLAQPYEANTRYTQNVVGNDNTLAGVATVGANTPVKLVNNVTGEEIYTGSGFTGMQQAAAAAEGLSGAYNSQANWSLYTGVPGTSDWNLAAKDRPDLGKTISTIADIGLTALGAAAGGPLGAAIGSAASSALAERQFKDAAIRAGIAAASTAVAPKVGKVVGDAVAPLLSKSTETAANAVAQKAFEEGAGEILVSGAKNLVPSLIGGGVGAAGAGALTKAIQSGSQNWQALNQVDPNQITVPGKIPSPVDLSAAGAGAFAGAAPNFTNPITGENEVRVTASQQAPKVDASSVAAAGASPVLGEVFDPYQINVTARKQVPDLGEVAGALASVGLPAGLAGNAGTTPSTTKSSTTDTLKKAYLGANLLGLLGKALGGGGSGTTSPGGQELQSVFSAKLPTPGEGGAFKVGGLDRVTPQPQDWYRYAMGPSAQVPAGTDLSRATSPYAGYGPGTLGEETFKRVSGVAAAHGGHIGYARGGSNKSFAVEGPGTGRSDDIPAVLSDGEYVIDAETVALLGDGSNRAGAKKLDDMRVKIRKHKGRNLAKGAFSVNAKKPENYLSGGRA